MTPPVWTVAALIAELQTWPAASEVVICEDAPPPSVVDVYPLVRVSGAAGGRVDGRDSCVTLEFRRR